LPALLFPQCLTPQLHRAVPQPSPGRAAGFCWASTAVTELPDPRLLPRAATAPGPLIVPWLVPVGCHCTAVFCHRQMTFESAGSASWVISPAVARGRSQIRCKTVAVRPGADVGLQLGALLPTAPRRLCAASDRGRRWKRERAAGLGVKSCCCPVYIYIHIYICL